MFEFNRDMMRIFRAEGPRDSLTGGDPTLLELMGLAMLRAEGRACDIAAGRISAKDRPQRQLEAAQVWREIARRTGDPVALRKAAATAEQAAEGFGRKARPKGWAQARCEQAFCALTAADLFGDEGLRAAADFGLREAEKVLGAEPAGVPASLGRLGVAAQVLHAAGDRSEVLALAARFDLLLQRLGGRHRARPDGRLLAADIRCARADMLSAAGVRLRDPVLLRMAVDGLNKCVDGLDEAFEPLARARAATARAIARASLAALDGEIPSLSQAVRELEAVLLTLAQDDSPLDWSRTKQALATVLQMLGEATESRRVFDRAITCFDQALSVFSEPSPLTERATAAYQRAVCLARRAEVCGDLNGLELAEAALRRELASIDPARDPVGWALRQLNFARLYEARAALTGSDSRDRKAAGVALSTALDVFGEHGLRSLSQTAQGGLDRLKAASAEA